LLLLGISKQVLWSYKLDDKTTEAGFYRLKLIIVI